MSIRFSSALLLVVLVAALMMTAASGMNLDKADKVAEVTTTKPKAKKPPGPECPCGYAVYFPLSRILEYYVRNESCECPPTQKCMRTHDDLSASAYVYHCRKQETNS